MSFKKSDYCTVVQQAEDTVPGFKQAYQQFNERATLAQNSKSMIINYSRCVAQMALHFGVVPHNLTSDEINSYLYRLWVHEGKSETTSIKIHKGYRLNYRNYSSTEAYIEVPAQFRLSFLANLLRAGTSFKPYMLPVVIFYSALSQKNYL